MRTYGTNLLDTQEMDQVKKPQAKKAFDDGKNVYVKLAPTMWLMLNNREDDEIPEFEYGIKFYTMQEYDDDKLIVTRHPNIAEYYKSKGINARVVQAARVGDVIGKTLYGGTIPPHIMAYAKESYILTVNNTSDMEFDKIPHTEFDNMGVKIKKYKVEAEIVEM